MKAALVPLGIVPPDDVSAFDELKVRSAVMVDDTSGGIVAGEALAFRISCGEVVTAPTTLFGVPAHPAPPRPGPKLQPHQLFVAAIVPRFSKIALPIAPVFPRSGRGSAVDALVPNGTDSPPPRAAPPDTALLTSALAVIARLELLPTTAIPPPSPPTAALPEIVLSEIVSEHSTQTMPPPFEPTLFVTGAVVERQAGERGRSSRRVVRPDDRDAAAIVARTALERGAVAGDGAAVEDTVAPRMLSAPPSDRKPLARPFVIVRLLTVSVKLPTTSKTRSSAPPLMVEPFPSTVIGPVTVRRPSDNTYV